MKNTGKIEKSKIKATAGIRCVYNNFIIIFGVIWFCYRSALLCEMEQRLKELNPESGSSNAGAIALRRSLP